MPEIKAGSGVPVFKLFDDAALLAKRTAAFITGRGATMTAVAIASRFVGAESASFAPMVGLSVGLPITAAMSTMVHHHRETTILNNFREEIAAYFHVAPLDVSHDHLRALAYGNEDLGIPAHPFFHEVLTRNDKNRAIDIGGNLVAAIFTLGFLHFQGAALSGAIASGLSAVGIVATAAAAPPALLTLGIAAVAGAMMLAMDNVFTAIGNELFAEKGRTAYEKTEGLARQQGHGQEVTPQQVMNVIASVHPDVQQVLTDRYHAASYDLLPRTTRESLFQEFDKKLHITEIAEKINQGTIKINELAFIASGERSGVPERASSHQEVHNSIEQPAHSLSLAQQLQQAKDHIVTNMKEQQLANHVLRAGAFSPYMEDAHISQAIEENKKQEQPKASFAARFADRQAEQAVTSHVDRYLQSLENAPGIKLH